MPPSPEEMGNLLSSGTSMDQQVLSKVFEATTKRLERFWTLEDEDTDVYWELLEKMRAFDVDQFSVLVKRWFRDLLLSLKSPTIHIMLSLVCNDLVTLPDILEHVMTFLRSKSDEDSPQLLLDLYGLLAGRNIQEALLISHALESPMLDLNLELSALVQQRFYRYSNQRVTIVQSEPDVVLSLFSLLFQITNGINGAVKEALLRILTMPASLALAQSVLSHDDPYPTKVGSILSQSPTMSGDILDAWLNLHDSADILQCWHGNTGNTGRSYTSKEVIQTCLTTVDDFNVEICALRLKFSFETMSVDGDRSTIEEAVATLIAESARLYYSHDHIWMRFVVDLPLTVASKVSFTCALFGRVSLIQSSFECKPSRHCWTSTVILKRGTRNSWPSGPCRLQL